MPSHTYALTEARIGKFKGDTLKRAQATEVTARWGRNVRMPQNNSDTYIARRWLPHGATSTSAATQNTFFNGVTGDRAVAYAQAHATQEGVTPTPENITPVDFPVVIQQYSCLYGYSDKTAILYEDAIPPEMEKIVGERITLVNEMVNYGVLKATTNQYYGGGGTSIATVAGPLTLGLLQNVVRSLQANHAGMVTTVLKPGPNYDTEAVSGGYVCLHSSDMEPDIRALSGFTPAEKYANGTPFPNELGKCERTRFICTPDFPARLAAGVVVASAPTMFSAGGVNIDVHQVLIMGEDAWSQIAVRGFESAKINVIPPGQIDKSDPNGQRGYVGAIWWKAALIENNGWLACVNVGRKITS
jgi:N4-gp56 family major capsid protein